MQTNKEKLAHLQRVAKRTQNDLFHFLKEIRIHKEFTCSSCKQTGGTTDLNLCEVGNENYPYPCHNYKPKE